MSENEDEKDSIKFMLSHSDKKEINGIKEENIYEEKLKTSLYDRDDEELYIATSPAFSPVQKKSDVIEDLYDSDHELCKEKSEVAENVKCADAFELDSKTLSDDNFSNHSPTIEYSPIKTSDSYPVINDNSSYFVAADYSHMNIDVSKAYFYVLSPTGTSSALLRSSSDEPLIRVNSDQLISITPTDSKCFDGDQVTPCISEHRLSSDDEIDIHESANLSEFKHDASEHIDLVQNEIEENEEHSMHGHFDNLSGDLHFISSIENSVDDAAKERSHLIWQSLSSDGESEKHSDQSHSLLMKYDEESKMESPVLHVQPYLHVALVNDMDPSSTGEFVSTDQILGVTVPEIFSCKWEGCGTHTLTRDDLIKHVNTNHIVSEQKDNYTSYTCFWKGCVRERKPFDARYKIVIHLRTHTGDKPHGCPVKGCDASFSRIENLKIHMRSHTGEKPYPCQFEGCKKVFANSSDRFKHKRTHMEKKPYRCPIIECGKSYTDPSSLRKHKKRHLLEAKKRSELEELDRRKLVMEYGD